jgi:hypothetical protein
MSFLSAAKILCLIAKKIAVTQNNNYPFFDIRMCFAERARPKDINNACAFYCAQSKRIRNVGRTTKVAANTALETPHAPIIATCNDLEPHFKQIPVLLSQNSPMLVTSIFSPTNDPSSRQR